MYHTERIAATLDMVEPSSLKTSGTYIVEPADSNHCLRQPRLSYGHYCCLTVKAFSYTYKSKNFELREKYCHCKDTAKV